DPIAAAERLELADLLVDVVARRNVRRAHHDQELRRLERSDSLRGKRRTGGKVLAIAEDRAPRSWHRAGRRGAPGQVPCDAIPFERTVQPLAPRPVAVAVAQERAVLEARRVGQRSPLRAKRGNLADRLQRGEGFDQPGVELAEEAEQEGE